MKHTCVRLKLGFITSERSLGTSYSTKKGEQEHGQD